MEIRSFRRNAPLSITRVTWCVLICLEMTRWRSGRNLERLKAFCNLQIGIYMDNEQRQRRHPLNQSQQSHFRIYFPAFLLLQRLIYFQRSHCFVSCALLLLLFSLVLFCLNGPTHSTIFTQQKVAIGQRRVSWIHPCLCGLSICCVSSFNVFFLLLRERERVSWTNERKENKFKRSFALVGPRRIKLVSVVAEAKRVVYSTFATASYSQTQLARVHFHGVPHHHIQ